MCLPSPMVFTALVNALACGVLFKAHFSPDSHLSWSSWLLSFLMKVILFPLARDLEMLLELLLYKILKILT